MIDKIIKFILAIWLLIFIIALFIEVNSYHNSIDLANSTWSHIVMVSTLYWYGISIIVIAIIGMSFYMIGSIFKAIYKLIKGK